MSKRNFLKKVISDAMPDIGDHCDYRDNEQFNIAIDNGDLGEYIINLNKPDGTLVQIAAVSKALFFSDRAVYNEILTEYRINRLKNTLRTTEFPENENSWRELKNLINSGATIIPFIGAGFSVPAGCPSWTNYISDKATKAGMSKTIVDRRLKKGEHEAVLVDVIGKLTAAVFSRDFAQDFKGNDVSLSPSAEFIGLIDGPMITLNFDRVLEDCHANKNKHFREKIMGRAETGAFLKALYSREKYLLKLHGNIDDPKHRIFTKDEYDSGYGSRDTDYALPIPKTLAKIFSSYSVLFCGCSLLADRYLEVLQQQYKIHSDSFPGHFAILNAPANAKERIKRDKFLAQHGITPIWYAAGDWDAPKDFLSLLKEDF